MFDPTSRYFGSQIATLQVTDPDGIVRAIRYVQRRIIPPLDSMTTILKHTVIQGERIDTITAHYIGDPTQFWRICDANNVISPSSLTDTPGNTIKISLPSL